VRILLGAPVGTQALVTLIGLQCVYELDRMAMGLVILCYAVAWFPVSDGVKLTAYRILEGEIGLLGQTCRRHACGTA
jgi:hypothetical protein